MFTCASFLQTRQPTPRLTGWADVFVERRCPCQTPHGRNVPHALTRTAVLNSTAARVKFPARRRASATTGCLRNPASRHHNLRGRGPHHNQFVALSSAKSRSSLSARASRRRQCVSAPQHGQYTSVWRYAAPCNAAETRVRAPSIRLLADIMSRASAWGSFAPSTRSARRAAEKTRCRVSLRVAPVRAMMTLFSAPIRRNCDPRQRVCLLGTSTHLRRCVQQTGRRLRVTLFIATARRSTLAAPRRHKCFSCSMSVLGRSMAARPQPGVFREGS